MQGFELLNSIVLNSGLVLSDNHKKVVAYLSVVLLKASFVDLSRYYNKPENEVRDVVTRYACRLNNNRDFAKILFELANRFYTADLIKNIA